MSQIIPIYIPTYINSANYTPSRVLPRLLFYNGQIECEKYYIQQLSPGYGGISEAQYEFPYFDNYNVVSGSFPTTDSRSLLFNNEPPAYGQLPIENLYTTYWEKYISFLYNPKTRVLNCQAIIPLADYFKMELNDIVNFRGNYWHLRAINDYSLKTGECNLQLLGPVIPDVFYKVPPVPPIPQSSSVSWSYTETSQNGEFKVYDNATTLATLTANGSGNARVAPAHYVTASLVPVGYPGDGVTMSLNVNGGTTISTTAYTNTTISASFLVGDGSAYTITGSIIYNAPPDADAEKFIAATGISGSTASAINTLVSDLKSYGLWNQMKAVYPLVGGSSSSTSYNLINTGSYQITWSGGITYASTGVTGNGSTGFGNTNLTPSVDLSGTSSIHLSAYIRTDVDSNAYDIGGSAYPDAATSTPENMIARFGDDRYAAFSPINVGPFVISNGTTHTGFFVGTNLSNTSYLYLNATSLVSASKTFGLAIRSMGVLGQLVGGGTTPSDLSSREYAFFSIGAGLDSTQVSNFNTCVATFQTALGRNV